MKSLFPFTQFDFCGLVVLKSFLFDFSGKKKKLSIPGLYSSKNLEKSLPQTAG